MRKKTAQPEGKKKNPEEQIIDVLLTKHYVSAEDMAKAKEFAEKHHTPIVEYLLNQQIMTRDLLGQATAELYGVPYLDLRTNPPAAELVLSLPEETAKKYRAVVVAKGKTGVTVASDHPASALADVLKKTLKTTRISVGYSLPEHIDAAFIHYRQELKTRFESIIKSEQGVAPKIIDEIFDEALVYRTSDIHIERQEGEAVIRFRIDGIMHEAVRIPKEYCENIINRIKVMAHLRIDEHYAVQDGAIRYGSGDMMVDMRVSIVPTLEGEKVVIRLLAKQIQGFSLSDIGLSPAHQRLLSEAVKKPFGMIIVTGPTGSGKTTTLYGLLKLLNHPEVNITTVEDPVEYRIPGANQIQVSAQTNLTFAKGLRAIVRQNPDIILVGEIRDQETAEIAVNAALTGHLLLSTFHANDAATAIPRLLYMGIEPFLLSSTLEMIISQRLVRRICESCRFSATAREEYLKKIFPDYRSYFDKKQTVYKGKGCAYCHGSGYNGRTAIFEIIPITKEMENLILERPSGRAIWELAKKEGVKAMFEDGMEKVKNGVTTIEELLRVAAPQTN